SFRIHELELATIENQSQPVTGDPRVYTALSTQSMDSMTDSLPVASHDFAAAVGKEGGSDLLLSAPVKLRSNRGVADQNLSAPAHQRAIDRRAVAHVQAHVLQRTTPIADRDHIGSVEQASTTGGNAVTDGWRS